MDESRSIQEREIITRILGDNDIISLSGFLVEKGTCYNII